MTRFPPYLKPGDAIGILCPAGYMPYEKAETAIATIKEWGFRVKVGRTLGNQFNYFSGTDEERLNDLQEMLDDKNLQAIFCARGGYGVSRIIDRLKFKKFKKHPKWIIGFSDITLLHHHLYTNLKVSSLHAPMAAAFNDGEHNNIYIQSLHDALVGRKATYGCIGHELNRNGKTKGVLVGGNLSLLAHACGTASDINTRKKLLFLEDIGEYIYNIDRMMYQLKRCGKLDGINGLIIGKFSDMKDTNVPFGQSADEVIKYLVKDYHYPVCFDFPVSHEKENYALKIGGKYELTVSESSVQLEEL
jgi:muramoyltetrapeptide carboxypeptidase